MRHKFSIDALAARQFGVVTRAQLLEMGWSPSRIARDRRALRLHPVYAGVYAVGHRAITDRGRWLAAKVACDGVLSYQSAGALSELPISDNGLTRVTAATARRRARIDVHRADRQARDRTTRHGIPVTTIARTLVIEGV